MTLQYGSSFPVGRIIRAAAILRIQRAVRPILSDGLVAAVARSRAPLAPRILANAATNLPSRSRREGWTQMSRTGLAVSCALLGLISGCMHSPDVVRSQGPEMMSYEHAPGMQAQMGGGHGHQHGPGMSCPSCPQPHQKGFDFWRPTHHHTWEYTPPQNLKYPDPNQPPAVVQYPYYTVKGPTDFFYTGE